MPREYCNESKPDNYVTYGGNSNLCILNKFSGYKTSKGLLLMKTKTHLWCWYIYHTGGKKAYSTNYLSSNLSPNSSNNANNSKETDSGINSHYTGKGRICH